MKHKPKDTIERIYDIVDELAEVRANAEDQSQARNLSLAITHLEDAALRVGPPLWYRPNPGAR